MLSAIFTIIGTVVAVVLAAILVGIAAAVTVIAGAGVIAAFALIKRLVE